MTPRKFEPRNTEVPGPRTRIKLDVAEASLPFLVAGIDNVRCWLTEQDDGVYTFHATQTIGQSRAQPGEPVSDLLVNLINELGDALDADDVPQRLRDLWDDLLERYENRTAIRTEVTDAATAIKKRGS